MEKLVLDLGQLEFGKELIQMFQLSDSYFASKEYSIVEKGNVLVEIQVSPGKYQLEVSIGISGSLELECDRSGDKFYYPIKSQEKLVFKYSDRWEELDENNFLMPKENLKIELDEILYNLILIQIPHRKVKPEFESADSEDSMIFSTGDTEALSTSEDVVDPRFAALKKLKESF